MRLGSFSLGKLTGIMRSDPKLKLLCLKLDWAIIIGIRCLILGRASLISRSGSRLIRTNPLVADNTSDKEGSCLRDKKELQI